MALTRSLIMTTRTRCPEIEGIDFRDVVAENVTMAGMMQGISGDSFTGICISNVRIGMAKKGKKYTWSFVDVKGISSGVVPHPCNHLLVEQGEGVVGMCEFPPVDSLAIDAVELQKCSHIG
ncbi:probable polygalacturonase [Primulina huaijiensis]|uniref:probable polygalacturonase n=1 Tax=Primulina huaijiensis TaxID=1492673 RepID=UPI003CC6F1D4